MSAPEEREHNWYPVSQVGWFTAHIREGIAVTGHQLELLQPALARPGRLDDATVARIIGSIKSRPATWSISRTRRTSGRHCLTSNSAWRHC